MKQGNGDLQDRQEAVVPLCFAGDRPCSMEDCLKASPPTFCLLQVGAELFFQDFGLCVEPDQKFLVLMSYRKKEFVFHIGINGMTSYCFNFYRFRMWHSYFTDA